MYNFNTTGFEIISLRVVLEVYRTPAMCIISVRRIRCDCLIGAIVPISKFRSLYLYSCRYNGIVMIIISLFMLQRILFYFVRQNTQTQEGRSRERYYWHIPIVCCRPSWRRFPRVRIDWHRIWVSTFCCRRLLESAVSWCFRPNR